MEVTTQFTLHFEVTLLSTAEKIIETRWNITNVLARSVTTCPIILCQAALPQSPKRRRSIIVEPFPSPVLRSSFLFSLVLINMLKFSTISYIAQDDCITAFVKHQGMRRDPLSDFIYTEPYKPSKMILAEFKRYSLKEHDSL